MALFTFTNSKPPVDEIWRTIDGASTHFAQLPHPEVSKTIVWCLLASTTNFPATKDEINKFIEGKVEFSSIEQGFTQSVSAKYGITLHFQNIIELEHLDLLSVPDGDIKVPFFTLRQMFDITADSNSSISFLKAIMPDIQNNILDRFQKDIWGALECNVWTLQMRFSEFLKDFRTYFIAPEDTEAPIIIVPDEYKLKADLKKRLMTAYIEEGISTVHIPTYRIGD